MINSHSTSPYSQLFLLLIGSVFGNYIIGVVLSANMNVLKDASIFFLMIVMVLGCAGWLYQKTKNLPVVLLLLIAFHILVVIVKLQILIVPVILLGSYFYLKTVRWSWLKHALTTPLLIGVIFAVLVAGIGGGWRQDFLYYERLVSGEVHQDTLMHASIAAMIKNYSVISTGVNGVVEVAYHALSHGVFASWSLMSGLQTLKIYAFAPPMLLGGLLVFAVAFCIIEITQKQSIKTKAILIWFIVCFIFYLLKVLPFYKFGIINSHFTSASHTFSLVLLLSVLPLLLHTHINYRNFLLISCMTIIIGWTKIPPGLFLLGLLVLWVIMVDRRYIMPAIVTLAVFYWALFVLFDNTTNASSRLWFTPFEFINIWTNPDPLLSKNLTLLLKEHIYTPGVIAKGVMAIIIVLFYHFIIPWTVVVYYWKTMPYKQRFTHLPFIYTATTLAGIIALLSTVYIVAATHYFTNTVIFIALPFFVLIIYRYLHPLFNKALFHIPVYTIVLTFIFIEIFAGLPIVKGIYLHHRPAIDSGKEPDKLVIKLKELGQQHPKKNIVFDASILPTTATYYNDCVRLPLLHVTITERPWVGLLNKACNKSYGTHGYNFFTQADSRYKLDIPYGFRLLKP
jgi:hypothetical protein